MYQHTSKINFHNDIQTILIPELLSKLNFEVEKPFHTFQFNSIFLFIFKNLLFTAIFISYIIFLIIRLFSNLKSVVKIILPKDFHGYVINYN